MKLPAPVRKPASEDSVLPLVNIVFLLLIFFMLAGVLAQRPPFELTPPDTAQTPDAAPLDKQVLSVAANGRLALSGQAIDRKALGQALADWPAGKPLQIRADGRIKASALTGLFATLSDTGITEVDLLTRHDKP